MQERTPIAQPVAEQRAPEPLPGLAGPAAIENASEFCPVCNVRLASRSCKLICSCGYYMSCSDFY